MGGRRFCSALEAFAKRSISVAALQAGSYGPYAETVLGFNEWVKHCKHDTNCAAQIFVLKDMAKRKIFSPARFILLCGNSTHYKRLHPERASAVEALF